MKKGISFFLLSLLFIAPGCKDSKEISERVQSSFRCPTRWTPQQGRFELNKKVKGHYEPVATPEVQNDCRQSHRPTGNDRRYLVGANRQGACRNSCHHIHTPRKALPQEGYKLSVTPANITITASQPNGFFYAVQTLYQLLPPAVYGKVAQQTRRLVSTSRRNRRRSPFRIPWNDARSHAGTSLR